MRSTATALALLTLGFALVFGALAIAVDASAKAPRYGLHIVDGGTTPLVQDAPHEALVMRRDFVPYKAAPVSLTRGGRTLAWRAEDGSIHVGEGVTADQLAAFIFEVADQLAEMNRAAMKAMRGAYR